MYPKVNTGRFKLSFVKCRLVFQYVFENLWNIVDKVDGLRIFIYFNIFWSILIVIICNLRYVFLSFDDH